MSIERTHKATTHCDRYGCWQGLSYQTAHMIPDENLAAYARRNGWTVTPDGQHFCPEHTPEEGVNHG